MKIVTERCADRLAENAGRSDLYRFTAYVQFPPYHLLGYEEIDVDATCRREAVDIVAHTLKFGGYERGGRVKTMQLRTGLYT